MDFWQHQIDKPIYPDVIWSRPETKQGAGKLAIIGGSAGAMANLAAAYADAEKAGTGTIRLVVPDSLTKITKAIPHIEYAPSNPSGSFAKTALSEILSVGDSCDGVFFAGDMGKNSETSLMLETFLNKFSGPVFISSEAMESFPGRLVSLVRRTKTTLFLSVNQLQKLGIEAKLEKPITSEVSRLNLALALRELTNLYSSTLVLKKDDAVWFSESGKIVDSLFGSFTEPKATLWAIQQPEKHFKALVASCIE